MVFLFVFVFYLFQFSHCLPLQPTVFASMAQRWASIPIRWEKWRWIHFNSIDTNRKINLNVAPPPLPLRQTRKQVSMGIINLHCFVGNLNNFSSTFITKYFNLLRLRSQFWIQPNCSTFWLTVRRENVHVNLKKRHRNVKLNRNKQSEK